MMGVDKKPTGNNNEKTIAQNAWKEKMENARRVAEWNTHIMN